MLLSGCGIWTDFTTYFNLYFNTTQLYDEIQEDISQLPHEPFELKEPEISNAIKTKLNNLQEKASKILQHNAESSYFDDAVFMSGYAFYFSGNYIKAKRKFQELASLDNDDYNLKSKLWISKCDLQVRNFEDGINLLEQVKDSAIAREDDEVLKDVYKIIVSYHINREEYATAITEAENLINVSEDDELNALTAYQIGLLYLDEGNEEEAVKAFNLALDFSPDFETEFDSKFELAKLNKALGNIEESREMLNELYNEGKYSPFWGEVYYQLGLIEYDAENYEKAFNVFEDVNELYPDSRGALEAQLMLGEIMRNVYADYDSAKVYYDMVKNSKADLEIKERAQLYSQSINNYLNLKKDIWKSNRQITYLVDPQQFLIDSLAHQRYLAVEREKREEARRRPGDRGNTEETDITETTSDTTNTNINSPTDSLAVSDSTEELSGRDSLFAAISDNLVFDDDYLVKEKPVYPKVGIDTLDSYIAKDYYALGNLFFTDLIQPDSAYYYYDLLLTEFPNTKYKPRVLYALGAYYETKGDSTRSDSLYSIVYNDYKTHPLASEAAKKLGKPPLIRESDPAQAEFLEAEAQMDLADYDSAFVILKKIANNYPESIYKPKSLYTIGWLYENEIAQLDSAFLYYSKLQDEYKNSEYAVAVRKKVSLYSAEIEKSEKEEETDQENPEQGEQQEKTDEASSINQEATSQPSNSELQDTNGVQSIDTTTSNVSDTAQGRSLNNQKSQLPDTTSNSEKPDTTKTQPQDTTKTKNP